MSVSFIWFKISHYNHTHIHATHIHVYICTCEDNKYLKTLTDDLTFSVFWEKALDHGLDVPVLC